jgi:hypothetical protein
MPRAVTVLGHLLLGTNACWLCTLGHGRKRSKLGMLRCQVSAMGVPR